VDAKQFFLIISTNELALSYSRFIYLLIPTNINCSLQKMALRTRKMDERKETLICNESYFNLRTGLVFNQLFLHNKCFIFTNNFPRWQLEEAGK
jgi:hypothetical protein